MAKLIHTFKDVSAKLRFIKENGKETELFPILRQLFVAMGYSNVEITHGPMEYGKDIVFNVYDKQLENEENYAVVVKNKDIDMWMCQDGGEVFRQVKCAFEVPYVTNSGDKKYMNKVIVITNGVVSPQAKNVLSESISVAQRNNVIIWNYQKLTQHITKYVQEIFLSGSTGTQEDFDVNLYKTTMAATLAKLDNAKELFIGLSIEEINDIFVNVRTATKKYEQEINQYRTDKVQFREEVDDSISIINSNKHSLIKGIPTSGKTLLLKRIGINALQQYSNIGVFWFNFRDIIVEKFDILSSIKEQFAIASNGALWKKEYFSKVLLLFDALDEITSDEERRRILSSIKEQIGGDSYFKIIISSRELDIIEDKTFFENFEIVDLLPFDVGQALKLVKKIIPEDKTKSAKFVEAIRKQQLSNSLTRTPMALTLMAIMYKDDCVDLAELPANITELYSKFSDYYLDKWDATKGISSQYKYEEVKNIMGYIACYIHNSKRHEITTFELKTFLESLKQSHSFEELQSVDTYIAQLKARNSLLRYNKQTDSFMFLGISFQEYFASVYYDDSSEQELLDNIYDEWWQNVIVFYNGKNPKRSVFLHKLLNLTPKDSRSMYYYILCVSNSLQAAHLINNESVCKGIESIISTFDMFYRSTLNMTNQGTTIAYSWTTLDMVLQFRKLFERLFESRHIKSINLQAVADEIFQYRISNYTDVTLYCIAYMLMRRTKETKYFEIFLNIPMLNTRWDRIVYRDLQMLNMEKEMSPKVWNRIKRKQHSNREYIDKQFKEPAILHLSNGTSLIVKK